MSLRLFVLVGLCSTWNIGCGGASAPITPAPIPAPPVPVVPESEAIALRLGSALTVLALFSESTVAAAYNPEIQISECVRAEETEGVTHLVWTCPRASAAISGEAQLHFPATIGPPVPFDVAQTLLLEGRPAVEITALSAIDSYEDTNILWERGTWVLAVPQQERWELATHLDYAAQESFTEFRLTEPRGTIEGTYLHLASGMQLPVQGTFEGDGHITIRVGEGQWRFSLLDLDLTETREDRTVSYTFEELLARAVKGMLP